MCVTIAYICHIGASQVRIKLRDRNGVGVGAASHWQRAIIQVSSAALEFLDSPLTRAAYDVHLVDVLEEVR